MSKCLLCDHDVEPFISFGRMPIANGFLDKADFHREFFFELKVAYCPACEIAQLGELVDETKLFHGAYPFFSSTSKRMAAHFKSLSEWLRERYMTEADPFVVEMAAWSCGEHEAVDDLTLLRLIELATGHEEPLVREAAVAALGAIGDVRGLPAILHGTTDKPAIRRRAVIALTPFDGPDVDAALERALSDRDWQVRQAAEELGRDDD